MPNTHEYQSSTCEAAANIVVATDAQLSQIIDLSGTRLRGLETPAGLTSTAIRFRAGNDATSMQPLFDAAGTRVSVTVDGSARSVSLTDTLFDVWRFIQLDMGSAEGADRTILLLTKPS